MMGLKPRLIGAILPTMGYTKKQRREQKKRPFVPTNKAQAKKIKRQANETPGGQGTTLSQSDIFDQDTTISQQELSMVLVKTCWTEPGGEARQNFQLVEISPGRNQEQIRQEFLGLLPGTIPASATVTLSKPLFSK
jgi:hypothetical protein